MSFNKVNQTTGELTRIAGNGDVPIDSTPTQGSNHAVQSGGTFSAIKAVSDNVDGLSSQMQTLTSAFVNNVNENGCKNVLRVINKTTANYANIIYTPNSDGSISVSNTKASAIADYYLFAPDNKNENSIIPLGNDLERDVDYVLSTGRLSNAGVRLIINLYDKDRVGLGVNFETQTHATFNLSTLDPNNLAAYYRIYLRVSSGATPVDNAVIYPMICLATDYALDSSYAPPSKTNRQLTEDSVTWDDYSKLGAVNYLHNTLTTKTMNGVTYTVASDGSFTASTGSGGATANAIVDIGTITLKAGTYRLSGCPANGGDSKYYMNIAVTSGSTSASAVDKGNGAVFTLAQDSTLIAKARVISGQILTSPITFYPMIAPPSYNGPYVPYAKTNKELTEDLSTKIDIAGKPKQKVHRFAGGSTTATITVPLDKLSSYAQGSLHIRTTGRDSEAHITFALNQGNTSVSLSEIKNYGAVILSLDSITISGQVLTIVIGGGTAYEWYSAEYFASLSKGVTGEQPDWNFS